MISNSIKKIMLVGLPNSGKSQVYNNLTGEYTIVANSPLTTIELKRTRRRIGGRTWEVIDTPGLHCLYIHSEEELKVREAIFSETPAVIIQCIDANRLKQSLTLTADLLTLGIPMAISLNAMDETMRRGIWIDSEEFSRLLGVPVVESIALQGLGAGELEETLARARRGSAKIGYGEVIENGLSAIEALLHRDFPYKRTAALLILQKDPFILDNLGDSYGEPELAGLERETQGIAARLRGNINHFLNKKRNQWIDQIAEMVIRKQKIAPREFTQGFARLSRHPLYGVPVLLFIIYTMYLLVVKVANVGSEWMHHVLWAPVKNAISGITPAGFWHDLLIGDYGVLSLGLANALLTVLPILTVFFLMFNTLEDIGYIANLTVLTKRVMGKLGLSGGAIMPLVLGFGCKTMATLTTKTLSSRKEKYIAIYLITFAIPCSAQMGLNMSILGRMGLGAFAIAFSVLTFVGIVAGIILNRILKEKEARPAFIQELPAIRIPNLKGVIEKTYYRLYWFLKESLLIFIYAALALFTLDKVGLLGAAKRVLSPIVEEFLGLPLAMVDAIILCFARHEAGAGLVINLIQKGRLNYTQTIVAVIITTIFAPCFANIMAVVKEIGRKRTAAMLGSISMSSILTAGILNWILVILI